MSWVASNKVEVVRMMYTADVFMIYAIWFPAAFGFAALLVKLNS